MVGKERAKAKGAITEASLDIWPENAQKEEGKDGTVKEKDGFRREKEKGIRKGGL